MLNKIINTNDNYITYIPNICVETFLHLGYKNCTDIRLIKFS